jgi:hypothetical protein
VEASENEHVVVNDGKELVSWRFLSRSGSVRRRVT